MPNIVTWPGSSSFAPGQTPFGFYDSDLDFQVDADRVARFCAIRLGYPLMDVELQSGSFYACFEEAVTTYGNEILQYKIKENYLSMEGISTGSFLNQQLIQPTLNRVIEISKNYGTEVEVGGYITLHTGSLAVTASIQDYNLNTWARQHGVTGSIEIRKIYYEAPPAILRYFDPYAGTGTGIQSLMEAFDFGTFSPGITFLLQPMYYDVLKLQAIEFNDQIRKSGYSFKLINNRLTILPIPKRSMNLRFEYFLTNEKNTVTPDTSSHYVTNISEVPYQNPTYRYINSVGRQWIYRYTLALAKELLAYVRGKYATLPVPDSETTLNQADLLTDARDEKQKLIEFLRDILDQTSRQQQLERKASETENLGKTLLGVPLKIYVG